MQTQPKPTFTILGSDPAFAAEYLVGEKEGRRDGARRYGMADASKMNEARACGYRDGYNSTICL